MYSFAFELIRVFLIIDIGLLQRNTKNA